MNDCKLQDPEAYAALEEETQTICGQLGMAGIQIPIRDPGTRWGASDNHKTIVNGLRDYVTALRALLPATAKPTSPAIVTAVPATAGTERKLTLTEQVLAAKGVKTLDELPSVRNLPRK